MKNYGLTFNGKHSFNDFGLIMVSKNRPILPEPKTIVEDVPCTDGEYNYSEANPDGRVKYKPRPHDVEFQIKESDPALLRILAHQVAVWLACGEKPLTYDDETPVYYLARVTNKIDLETQIIRVKKFTVQFKCRPYAYSAVTSNEQIEFGKGLMCGYGYRFDMVPTVYNIISNATKSIYNPGTWVKPVIRVVGTCSSISFAVNGKTLAYGAAVNGQIDIDCYKQEAYKDGVSSQANNVLNNVSGDWLEMINGDNTLQISGTDLNCTVTFIFNYLYL